MNHQIKKTIIFYFYPLVAFRRWVIKQKKNYLGHHNPEKLAKLLYRRKFHKELNLNNPQTFNEKVNWLKFFCAICGLELQTVAFTERMI